MIAALPFSIGLGLSFSLEGFLGVGTYIVSFGTGLFIQGQMVIPLLYGLPMATWLWWRGQVKFALIPMQLVAPVMWFLFLWLIGYIIGRLSPVGFAIITSGAFSLGGFFSFLAILLNFFSAGGRANMWDDFRSDNFSGQSTSPRSSAGQEIPDISDTDIKKIARLALADRKEKIEQVVSEYGKILAEGEGTLVRPVSTLPYPKDKIAWALREFARLHANDQGRLEKDVGEKLHLAYRMLGMFIDDKEAKKATASFKLAQSGAPSEKRWGNLHDYMETLKSAEETAGKYHDEFAMFLTELEKKCASSSNAS